MYRCAVVAVREGRCGPFRPSAPRQSGPGATRPRPRPRERDAPVPEFRAKAPVDPEVKSSRRGCAGGSPPRVPPVKPFDRMVKPDMGQAGWHECRCPPMSPPEAGVTAAGSESSHRMGLVRWLTRPTASGSPVVLLILTLTTGAVDAISFVALGDVFTSVMTATGAARAGRRISRLDHGHPRGSGTGRIRLRSPRSGPGRCQNTAAGHRPVGRPPGRPDRRAPADLRVRRGMEVLRSGAGRRGSATGSAPDGRGGHGRPERGGPGSPVSPMCPPPISPVP